MTAWRSQGFDVPGLLMVLGSAVCFALTPTLNRLAYDAGADTMSITTVRFVVAVPTLLLVALALGRVLRVRTHVWKHSAIIGVMMVLTAYGYVGSVAYIPVSLSSLIFYSFPLVVGLLGTIVSHERLTWLRATLMLAAFGGLVLTLSVAFDRLDPLGIALAAFGALCAAGSFMWTSRTLHPDDAIVSTLYMMAVACAIALVVQLAAGPPALPQTTLGWFAFLANAGFYTVGLLGLFGGIARIGATPAAMLSNIEPIISILLAIAVLGERLDGWQWLGVAIVLGMIAIMAESDRREAATRTSPAD
ncbi:MAG: DMT family transporter [Alphaproteobacteria bacterium]|nr:DMT family transporter [Alphaproteobacteria bacterium]